MWEFNILHKTQNILILHLFEQLAFRFKKNSMFNAIMLSFYTFLALLVKDQQIYIIDITHCVSVCRSLTLCTLYILIPGTK